MLRFLRSLALACAAKLIEWGAPRLTELSERAAGALGLRRDSEARSGAAHGSRRAGRKTSSLLLCGMLLFARIGPTVGSVVENVQKISMLEGGLSTYVTLDESDNFGSSVASIGDLNGDGVPDLAVGAYDDDDGSTNAGAVYILSLIHI